MNPQTASNRIAMLREIALKKSTLSKILEVNFPRYALLREFEKEVVQFYGALPTWQKPTRWNGTGHKLRGGGEWLAEYRAMKLGHSDTDKLILEFARLAQQWGIPARHPFVRVHYSPPSSSGSLAHVGASLHHEIPLSLLSNKIDICGSFTARPNDYVALSRWKARSAKCSNTQCNQSSLNLKSMSPATMTTLWLAPTSIAWWASGPRRCISLGQYCPTVDTDFSPPTVVTHRLHQFCNLFTAPIVFSLDHEVLAILLKSYALVPELRQVGLEGALITAFADQCHQLLNSVGSDPTEQCFASDKQPYRATHAKTNIPHRKYARRWGNCLRWVLTLGQRKAAALGDFSPAALPRACSTQHGRRRVVHASCLASRRLLRGTDEDDDEFVKKRKIDHRDGPYETAASCAFSRAGVGRQADVAHAIELIYSTWLYVNGTKGPPPVDSDIFHQSTFPAELLAKWLAADNESNRQPGQDHLKRDVRPFLSLVLSYGLTPSRLARLDAAIVPDIAVMALHLVVSTIVIATSGADNQLRDDSNLHGNDSGLACYNLWGLDGYAVVALQLLREALKHALAAVKVDLHEECGNTMPHAETALEPRQGTIRIGTVTGIRTILFSPAVGVARKRSGQEFDATFSACRDDDHNAAPEPSAGTVYDSLSAWLNHLHNVVLSSSTLNPKQPTASGTRGENGGPLFKDESLPPLLPKGHAGWRAIARASSTDSIATNLCVSMNMPVQDFTQPPIASGRTAFPAADQGDMRTERYGAGGGGAEDDRTTNQKKLIQETRTLLDTLRSKLLPG